MRTGICGVAVLMGAMGIVADVAAMPENNPNLAPLIPALIPGTCSETTISS
jgi:hypothetical protein